jgi:hypothetical protein
MKKLVFLALIVGLVGCSSDNKEVESVKVDPEIQAAYKEQMRQKQAAYPKINIPKSMDVVEMAKCTAAAMKAGQGIELFNPWAEALTLRYKAIYPNKNSDELDRYTTERIIDKRRYLESIGISTSVGFYKFYKQNCQF